MTEQRTDGLSYGHLGEAFYDTNNGQWLFSHQFEEGLHLRPIGFSATSIPSSELFPEGQQEHVSGQALHQRAKSVVAKYPELVPGLATLESFAHTSQHITSLTSIHDPLISDQLVFGRAVDLDSQNSGARTIPIIAVAAGKAGDAVRLVRVELARHGWRRHEEVSLAVPEIARGEEGWWVGNSGPIQQIRCAELAGESSTWMAIRLLHSTVILHPLYHRAPVAASSAEGVSTDGRFPPSRLDANPVLSLPIGQTGGVPHADVNFNPWYQRQIAVVDQHGTWSIWDLEGQERKRVTYELNAGKVGHIYDGYEMGNSHQNNADGWGAICVAGNVNTLVVCNRRHMAVFDVSGKPNRLGAPDLGLSRNSDWILDLRRSSRNRSHIFVLTSSRITWLHVTGACEYHGIDSPKTGATNLLSWCHFRDGEDTGLRLHVIERGGGYLMLLYSRLTSLVTTFEFSMFSLSPSHAVSVSDPHTLRLQSAVVLPQDSAIAGAPFQCHSTISCIAVQPTEYHTRPGISSADPDHNHLAASIEFYKLFMLPSDLSIRECLYVGRSGTRNNDPRVFPPDQLIKSSISRSATVVTDDRFVVLDDEAAIVNETEDVSFDIIGTCGISKRLATGRLDHSSAEQWTVDSEAFYGLVAGSTSMRLSKVTSATLEERNSHLSIELVRERLNDKLNSGARSIESLLEILVHLPNCADVDGASLRMQDILKSVRDREDNGDANVYTELKDLSLPGLLGLEVYDHGDQIPAGVPLANTYDYLIDHWLRPLSSRIPGRARMAREKILRRVVLALCLARIGVCVREDRSPAAIKVDLRLDQLQLPVRQKNDIDTSSRKGKGRQPEALSSPPPSSQLSVDTGFVVEVNLKNSEQNTQASLTTPDPTPSVHSTSSVSSLMAEGEDPACARLRQYTTLESRPHLPSSISKLLSHWVIGADPAHYDWETAERSLHLTSDTESAEDDNRVKIRHRREQRLKQRRGVMAGSASQPNPSRLWASQPQHMESIQGSSQMVDDVVPMSQVERGAFGGRQTSSEHAAKRRKRRAAGF